MRIGVRLVGTRAWAQAVIRGVESDAVQRLERYPAEDVGMDPTGTGIPDAEFHEEPHLEEAQIPEEVPNAIRLVIMRVHKKNFASKQGIALSRFANWRSQQDGDQCCE